MKRKLPTEKKTQNNALKKSKLLVDKQDRLSELPEEIHLEILKKLKLGYDSIVTLSQTSRLFNELCVARLKLRLDFDRIKAERAYPVVRNAYEEVVIAGAEIDEDLDKIKGVLRSSRWTAKKLIIGVEDDGHDECLMSLRALLTILAALPNVSELELKGVKAIKPITSFTAIPSGEYPVLGSLKQLTVNSCAGATLSAFTRLTTLVKLQVNIEAPIQRFSTIVAQQQGLQSFKTNFTHGLDLASDALLSLKTYEGPDEGIFCCHTTLPQGIFEIAPNVEHIKITSSMPFETFITEDSFLLVNESDHLKTIETEASVDLEDFSIAEIRANYPNLQSFKSSNLEWRRVVV